MTNKDLATMEELKSLAGRAVKYMYAATGFDSSDEDQSYIRERFKTIAANSEPAAPVVQLVDGAKILESAMAYLNEQNPKNWEAVEILNKAWGKYAKEYFSPAQPTPVVVRPEETPDAYAEIRKLANLIEDADRENRRFRGDESELRQYKSESRPTVILRLLAELDALKAAQPAPLPSDDEVNFKEIWESIHELLQKAGRVHDIESDDLYIAVDDLLADLDKAQAALEPAALPVGQKETK